MKASELLKIQEAVGEAVEKHVNGKIRAIDAKLDNYIKSDNEWKEEAKPTIELGNNIRGFGKVFAYMIGVAGVLFGAIKGGLELTKFLK